MADSEAEKVIYGVHAVRLREICATQFVTARLAAAEKYATVMSTDPGVLAAAVTRYVMGAEGQNRAEALYVAAQRQQVPSTVAPRTPPRVETCQACMVNSGFRAGPDAKARTMNRAMESFMLAPARAQRLAEQKRRNRWRGRCPESSAAPRAGDR